MQCIIPYVEWYLYSQCNQPEILQSIKDLYFCFVVLKILEIWLSGMLEFKIMKDVQEVRFWRSWNKWPVFNNDWAWHFILTSFCLLYRDIHGKMYFLRVEVVLQDATYFIVFTDADTIPPTIRLDNYSEVPLQFHQACIGAYTVLYAATLCLWFL